MAKALNTGDALYGALSHLFCVDDDNTVKELKASLACTVHANVLVPGTGATSSPVGRSFRTGGAAGAGPAVYGVSVPNYVVSNGANLSVFVAVNQFNGANAAGAGYGAMLFSSDTPGIKAGTGIQVDPATGAAYHNNNNGSSSLGATVNTAASITGGSVKSFGFTRTAAGVVKFYVNGVVDTNYTGGIANTGSQFGAAWTTAELALIGGMDANSWASFDFAYVCDFLGTLLSEADMLRLHNSLTGSDAFALINLPAAPAPTVTTQPASSSVTEGATATFTGVFGNSPTSFAWEYADSPYSTWAAVTGGSGAATASYTTAATTLGISGRRYRCTATNAGGSVTTNGAAELTVTASGDTVDPVLTGVITVGGGTVTSTGWQANCNVATDNVGVVSYDWSADGGATWINWPVNNYTFDGYAPGTTYALRARARDAAGRMSAVVSGSVTTLLPTVTTDVLEDENGIALASTLIAKVVALKLSDMTVAATWTNQTTSSGGVLVLQHASLTAVPHIIVTSSATGAAAGAKVYAPAV